jgi:hypothetical protein
LNNRKYYAPTVENEEEKDDGNKWDKKRFKDVDRVMAYLCYE